jgi:hypothetical protein
MNEMKKYTDIIRLGHKSTSEVLKQGDYITITEKIDGANASFTLNEESQIDCFSRNTQLSAENTLRGFYGWILDKIATQQELLNTDYIYYGEWLVSHKVVYRPEAYNNFYLFSIWSKSENKYLSDDVVKAEAVKLNLSQPHYFYEGEYISFEHLLSFVGQSKLTPTGDKGEGVVVKNVDYIDNYGRQMFVKLVSSEFAEIQKQKLPKNPNPNQAEVEQIKTILTKARVEKLLYKLVDEGILDSNFGIEDMGIILKNISTRVYEDMIKEESEFLTQFEEDLIRKTVGKTIPTMVKEIINTKQIA